MMILNAAMFAMMYIMGLPSLLFIAIEEIFNVPAIAWFNEIWDHIFAVWELFI